MAARRTPAQRARVFWKYAMAQSPEEFADVSALVLAMFTVSECGQWLTSETLTEECGDRLAFADELSLKRSEAGKKGSAARWSVLMVSMAKPSQTRWQTGWQNEAKPWQIRFCHRLMCRLPMS